MSSESEQRIDSIRRLIGQANVLISEMSSPRTEGSHTGINVAESGGTLSTPGRVLSELRRISQPYSREGQRNAGRQARRTVASREWIRRFVCLDGPMTKAPNPSQLTWLRDEGLGEQIVTTVSTCDSNTLTSMLKEMYPKLGTTLFSLYKTVGGGAGQPLVRVHQTMPVPGVGILASACRGIVYVRPDSSVLEVTSGSDVYEGRMEETDVIQTASSSLASSESPVISNDIITPGPMMNSFFLTQTSTTAVAGTSTSTIRSEPASLLPDLLTEDLLTVDEYRERLYGENSDRQRIEIGRENFLEELFGVYKNPNFDFTLKPYVKFVGEAGADIGAVTKEYFWKGFISLMQDKLDGKSLFEGAADHRIPTVDSRLLRCGAFSTVGLFIGHAIIHSGIGCLGLSQAVVEYLTTKEIDCDTPFSITIDDVADLDVRDALQLVDSLKCGATLSVNEQRCIQEAAQMADYNELVTQTNASEVTEHLLYHQVIEKRKPYLDAIRAAMKRTGVLEFLFEKPYLRTAIFPRTNDASYPISLIIDRIESSGDERVFQLLKLYIEGLNKEQIKKLLAAWTGWPIIPEGQLKIVIEDDGEFKAHSCFNTIHIPSHFTAANIKYYMDLLLEYSEGFGSI